MSEEQLYGREGIESDSGYVPMPAPTNDEPAPEVDHDEAIAKWAEDRTQEARPIVERTYVQGDGDGEGRKQPDNRTVEMDRAARDLSENREAEAALAEFECTQQLAAEIDQARGLRPQPEAQPELQEQPHTPLVSELPQPQSAPADGVDPDVRAALQDPKVLAAVQQERAADLMRVDAVVNQATQFAQNNALTAVAAILARPELAGVPWNQLPGAMQALKVNNPTAHAEIGRQLANTQAVIQQATQAQQQQQQRHAVAFHEWGKANDDAFDRAMASESPETVGAIKQTSLQMLRDGGLSDLEIAHHWNSNPLMRSALGQQVLADAARWRLAKAGIKPAPKPVPQVARPGSGMDRPDAANRDSFALENRYRGPLSAKQAAELVIGRRARAR